MTIDTFLYPRTISIHRVPATSSSDFGTVAPYSGSKPSTEATIATNLPASIQYDRVGKNPDADLPASPTGRSNWKIFIPLESAPSRNSIKRGDVVVDDLAIRYIVNAPDWNSLGYQLHCDELVE